MTGNRLPRPLPTSYVLLASYTLVLREIPQLMAQLPEDPQEATNKEDIASSRPKKRSSEEAGLLSAHEHYQNFREVFNERHVARERGKGERWIAQDQPVKRRRKTNNPVETAATPGLEDDTSRKESDGARKKLALMDRQEKQRGINQGMVDQRGKMAKLYMEDEELLCFNAVRLNGEHVRLTYNFTVDWTDRRWILALNDWRSRTLYHWLGPVHHREKGSEKKTPFSEAEKGFIRKATKNLATPPPAGEWDRITCEYNDNDSFSPRDAPQLQSLRRYLDIITVEGQGETSLERRQRTLTTVLSNGTSNASTEDNDDEQSQSDEDEEGHAGDLEEVGFGEVDEFESV